MFAEGQQVDFEYSKSLVPLDVIGEMKGNFVPVRREEFDRMIGETNRSDRREFDQSHVIRANYSASFKNNSLVSGQARLVLSARPDSESRLRLPPFDLPVINPRWGSKKNPAVAGRSPDGSFVAIVPAALKKDSGTRTLRFDWSAKGERISASGSRIQLRLPLGPNNQLKLQLPKPLEPRVTRGTVSRNSNAKSVFNWIIQLGSVSETELEIYSPTLSDDDSPILLFDDAASYEVAQQGINCTTIINIEAFSETGTELKLERSRQAKLKRLKLDGKPVKWSESPAFPGPTQDTNADSTREIIVNLEQPLEMGKHTLECEFATPLPLNKKWQLPHVSPAGMTWTKGTARVRVQYPLSIAAIDLKNARQVAGGITDSLQPSRDLAFDYYSRDAAVELLVADQPARLRYRSGTAITLGGATTTATVVQKIEHISGETFNLVADVNPEWKIQSLEIIPKGILDHWSEQEPDGDSAATSNEPRQSAPPIARQLEVRLLRPVSQDSPLTVRITAKRERLQKGSNLTVKQMEVLRFRDVLHDSSLTAVRPFGTLNLRAPKADAMVPRDLKSLSDVEKRLVDARRGDYVFENSKGIDSLQFAVLGGVTPWKAEIHTTTTVMATDIRDVVTVNCEPDVVTPEEVVVAVSPARDQPVLWSLAGSSDSDSPDVPLTAAELQTPELASVDLKGNVQAWRIALPKTLTGSFRLTGERYSSRKPDAIILASSAWAPNATQCRSKTTVTADAKIASELSLSTGLEHLPIKNLSGKNAPFPAVGSCLMEESDFGTTPLTVRRNEPPARSWITSASTFSRFDKAGTHLHESRWQIKNFGADEIRFQVDPRYRLRRIQVNQRPQLDLAIGLDNTLTIPVSPAVRDIVISMSYSEKDTASGWWKRKLSVSPPQAACPELSHRWQIRLPRGVAPYRPARFSVSCAERLFGVMARATRPLGTSEDSESLLEFGELADGRGEIVAYNVLATRLLGWLMFLSLVAWNGSIPIRKRIIVGSAAGCALMICALPWLGVLRGLLWGVAVNWVRHQIPSAAAIKNGGSNNLHDWIGRRTTVAAAGVVALFIVTVLVRHGISQTPDEVPTTHYRVMFPVDENGDPDGKYLYVPQKMYESLVKNSEAQKPDSESWILNSATYKGRFSTRVNPDDDSARKTADGMLDYTIDTIKSSYSITTFEPGLTIVLPIEFQTPRDSVSMDIDDVSEDELRNEIRLDGQAIDWMPVDGGIQISIGAPGKHEVALATRLQPDDDESNDGARRNRSLPIIPLANSQLELLVPGEDIGVTIESPIGGVAKSRAGRILTANLGTIPELKIGWNPISRRIDRQQRVVSKIGRLKVLPGTAIYELCFVPSADDAGPNGEADPLNEIRFTLDDQYQPLSSGQQNCNVEVAFTDQRGRVLTATRKSGNKDRHLKVTLLIDGMAGKLPSEFQLPPVQLLDTKLADEWLGISFDPSLSYERTNNEAFGRVSRAEFGRLWPEPLATPQSSIDYALSRNNANTPWSIRALARQTTSLVEDELTLEYGLESVEVKFATTITPVEGEAFYHQVAGPKNLEIAEVTVKSNEVVQNASWYKQDNGVISLFLDGEAAGPRKIEIRGSVPNRLNVPATIPLVFTKNETTSKYQVIIYRRTDVLVEVLDAEGFQRTGIEIATGEPTEDLRPVARLAEEQTGGPAQASTPPATVKARGARVRVSPNLPSLVGDALTTMDMRSDGWFARYELQADVTNGVPDVIRLEIPATWGDDFTTVPPMSRTIEPLPNGNRRLELIPNSDQGDQRLEFTIEASVRSGETTELPRIELLGHGQVNHFVALPRWIGDLQREWKWDIESLKTEELPKNFQSRERTRKFSNYRRLGDYSARLLQPQELSDSEVLLKDVQLKIDNSMTTGIARFDLEPKGRSHGMLEMPSKAEVVAVLVDDRLTDFEPTEEANRCRFALGASRLPHQVEVIFRQQQKKNLLSAEQTIRVPRLLGATVRKTVWSVDANQLTLNGAKGEAVEITLPEYRQERITNALRTIRRTDEATSWYSLDELGMWYAGWRERVFNRLNTDHTSETPLATQTELDDIKRQVDGLAINLRIPEAFLNVDSDTAPQTGDDMSSQPTVTGERTNGLLIGLQGPAGQATIPREKMGYMTTRDPSTLQLNFQREWLGGLGGRVTMALAFGCLFVASWRRLLVEPAASFALRWPHLLLAVVGVVWLLWLKFAWIGLLLTVIACWLALAGGVAIQGIQGLILRDSPTMISSEIRPRR